MSEGWIDAIEERSGPLAAAARELIDWRLSGDGEFEPGREGIRQLAETVEAFCYDQEALESDDQRFVEGAGALLGVLLLEHLGGEYRGRESRHRVALGEHGFFDPFGAIDAALDADDPLAELRRQVAMAEAEARGEGPIGRVIGAFSACLWESRPQLQIEDQFELELNLSDEIEVDLRRVAESTEGQSRDAVTQAAAKLVAMLPGGDSDGRFVAWEEASERLIPRLVSAAFLDELHSSTETRGELFARPLGHDVCLTLLLSYQDRSRFVRVDEVEAWGVGSEGVQMAGLKKLAARSLQARFGEVETARGSILVARTGDGLDSARLLLPGLYAVLAESLEPPFVAAIPHRDALLACSAADPAILEGFLAKVEEDVARAPHAISAALFEVTERGVVPYEV